MWALLAGCARSPSTIRGPLLVEVTATRATFDAGAPVTPVVAVAVAPSDPSDVAVPVEVLHDNVRRFRGQDEEALLRAMATRPVVRVLHRFSSSTLVFHCDLGDGVEIAFKPARRGEHQWWKHEVLAYRLARVLGIVDRVPPAVSRRVPAALIEGFAHDRDLIRERDGSIRGVAITWMPVLHSSGLHTAEARHEWTRWMSARHDIPPAHRRRAGQIASLIAFDYLQANFDRWNGGNVPLDEHEDMVFRDNNRGWFLENLVLADNGWVVNLERIPASLLAGVERATADAVRAEVRRDGLPFHRLETAGYWAAYSARRTALLRRIAAAIAEHGRERVLLDE